MLPITTDQTTIYNNDKSSNHYFYEENKKLERNLLTQLTNKVLNKQVAIAALDKFLNAGNSINTLFDAQLLRYINGDQKSKIGVVSLLHLAIYNKHYDLVEYLLNKNIDPNIQTNLGDTALHIACYYNNDEINKVIEIMLQNHADTTIVDNDGDQPIYNACISKNTDAITLIINANAMCLEICNSKGETPLLYSAKKHYNKVVSHLITMGADLYAKDKQTGWQPIHYAAHKSNKELIKIFVNNGVNINTKVSVLKGGASPLLIAAQKQDKNRDDLDFIEFLVLNLHADLNSKGVTEAAESCNFSEVACECRADANSGVIEFILCSLFCFPFSLPCILSSDECSLAKRTIFPCLRPTPKSYLSASFIRQLESKMPENHIENTAVNEQPTTSRLWESEKLINGNKKIINQQPPITIGTPPPEYTPNVSPPPYSE